MGEVVVKNPEKLLTLFMDGPKSYGHVYYLKIADDSSTYLGTLVS